jgi:hypothetical protein
MVDLSQDTTHCTGDDEPLSLVHFDHYGSDILPAVDVPEAQQQMRSLANQENQGYSTNLVFDVQIIMLAPSSRTNSVNI